MTSFMAMKKDTFPRRGIAEGFFGPPWSMAHRSAMFEFGAAHRIDTCLCAPVVSCEEIHQINRDYEYKNLPYWGRNRDY